MEDTDKIRSKQNEHFCKKSKYCQDEAKPPEQQDEWWEPHVVHHPDDESILHGPCRIGKEEEGQAQQRVRSKYVPLANTSSKSIVDRLTCTDNLPSFVTPVVLSILITETAERFSYYGFGAILVLYFIMELHYGEDTAIALSAYKKSLSFFTPILGAVIADVYLGRYNTILLFGIIYGMGLAMLTFAAFLPDRYHDEEDEQTSSVMGTQWKRICTFVALFFVCVGTGGIKPCVSAFGADQVSNETSDVVLDDNDDDGKMASGDDLESNSDGLDAVCTKEEQIDSVTPLDLSLPPLMQQTNAQSENFSRLPPKETQGQFNDISTGQSSNRLEGENIRSFFAFFYFCNNVGAVTSIFLVPIIREHFSFGAAFLTPTLFHIVAFVIFISKRKEYKMHKPGNDEEGESLLTTFKVFWVLICNRLRCTVCVSCRYSQCCFRNTTSHIQMSSVCNGRSNSTAYRPHADACDSEGGSHTGWDDHSSLSAPDTSLARGHNVHEADFEQDTGHPNEKTGKTAMPSVLLSFSRQQIDDAAQVVHILPILAFIPVFWTLYDQQGSVWTLQATRMNLHGLQPEQLNAVNPVEIMFFVPIFDRCIYPALEARGWSVGHLDRMGWGMVMTAVSFVVSGFLESAIQSRQSHDGDTIHVLWQLPQITIMAVGEILLCVTGLEFAYSNAPERMKALIMAVYLLCRAFGDFLGGVLYSSLFRDMNRATAMYVCAGIMLVNLCVFCWVASWWEDPKIAAADPNNETEPNFPQIGDEINQASLAVRGKDIVVPPKQPSQGEMFIRDMSVGGNTHVIEGRSNTLCSEEMYRASEATAPSSIIQKRSLHLS